MWLEDGFPAFAEIKTYAKGMRSKEGVRNFFKAYRAKRKGGPAGDDAQVRQAGRPPSKCRARRALLAEQRWCMMRAVSSLFLHPGSRHAPSDGLCVVAGRGRHASCIIPAVR